MICAADGVGAPQPECELGPLGVTEGADFRVAYYEENVPRTFDVLVLCGSGKDAWEVRVVLDGPPLSPNVRWA